MARPSLPDITPPILEARTREGTRTAALRGHWNLIGFSSSKSVLRAGLQSYARDPGVSWDLTGVESLDSVGALLLWQAWGRKRPGDLRLREEHEALFARLQDQARPSAPVPTRGRAAIERLRGATAGLATQLGDAVALLGRIVLDLGYLLAHPRSISWREISANIHETGGSAMAITGLVGALIGVVLSYLSAVQLKTFGGSSFIVILLGISITRELGPILAAILVAGRSGSAITARLGVMRVTQELDALTALGISHTRRLVIPKVVALVVALPLLVVWSDFMGLLGGMTAAKLSLGVTYHQFINNIPAQLPVANFWIGIGKGAVFGFFIAAIACHFGLRVKPNTQSLGRETTNSVVAAITAVIIADAIAGILLQHVGLP